MSLMQSQMWAFKVCREFLDQSDDFMNLIFDLLHVLRNDLTFL